MGQPVDDVGWPHSIGVRGGAGTKPRCGITRFAVPESARARQTKAITVQIRNNYHLEMVRVFFLRSLPGGGFERVGSLTQSVPAAPHGSTTPFTVNYTFTPADAAIGKVTFKAYAIIVGARDALPADNETIAFPTRVNADR